MPILWRYFPAYFAAVFLCRFGAAGEEMFSCPFRGGETAKRRNGRAGAPPASKGRGLPGEEIFSCRFAAVFSYLFCGGIFIPILRRYFPAYFAAVFSCPFRGGIFMPFRGGIFMPFRGGIFLPVSGRRNGKTAKRPRRCVARKEGARAAGRGGMIFRAASPARGPLSAKKAKKSRKIALHLFDIS